MTALHHASSRLQNRRSIRRLLAAALLTVLIVAAMSLDPRVIGDITPKAEGLAAPVHAVAVTSDGYALRFGFDGLDRKSTPLNSSHT